MLEIGRARVLFLTLFKSGHLPLPMPVLLRRAQTFASGKVHLRSFFANSLHLYKRGKTQHGHVSCMATAVSSTCLTSGIVDLKNG